MCFYHSVCVWYVIQCPSANKVILFQKKCFPSYLAKKEAAAEVVVGVAVATGGVGGACEGEGAGRVL